MTRASFAIAGSPNFDCLIRQFPRFRIASAITWTELANGGFIGLDRTITGGLTEIIHESEIVFMGEKSYITDVQNKLQNDCREGASIVSINTPVFCPLVSQASSVGVTIEPKVAHEFAFARGPSGMYELAATIRADTYSYVSTSPSLDGLRLQPDFESGKNYLEAPRYSYTQVPSYANPQAEAGIFKAKFFQKTSELIPILDFILVSQRAVPFTFPTTQCGTYPFGPTMPEAPTCNITSFEIEQVSVDWFNLTIEFSQAF